MGKPTLHLPANWDRQQKKQPWRSTYAHALYTLIALTSALCSLLNNLASKNECCEKQVQRREGRECLWKITGVNISAVGGSDSLPSWTGASVPGRCELGIQNWLKVLLINSCACQSASSWINYIMMFLIKAKPWQISPQDQKPGCALYGIAWLLSQLRNILKSILPEWHCKASSHLNRAPDLQKEDKIIISEE